MNTLKRIVDFFIRNKIICICSLSGFVLVVVLFCAIATRDIDANATSKTWERTVIVQKYDWVHKHHSSEFMYPSIPQGARNTNSWMSSHVHRRSRTTYSGSGENRKSHTTYYNDYDTEYHVSYEIQEWTFSRNVVAKGTDEQKVEWPNVVYALQPPEREGNKTESFTIKFFFPYLEKEKLYTTNDYTIYNQIDVGRTYACDINYFGFIRKINGLNSWN